MVVCKFFLQGNCRYGDRCWNEHPRAGQADHNYGYGRGQQTGKPAWGGGGNRFEVLANQPTQSSSNANMTPQEMLQTIAEDIAVWSLSKMWPFSCYRVKKEAPLMPGFDDLSPEEMRMEAYTAEKSGTFQNYVSKISQMAAEYSTKRETLRQQGGETRQKLLQLLEKHTSSSSGQSALFGGQQTIQSSTGGLFGKPQTNTGTFDQMSGGLFGQGQTNTAGAFGQSQPQASVFGGQSASTGLFGHPQTSATGALSQPTGSVFGGQSQNADKGLFGKPAMNQTGSVFGQATFGNQPQAGTGLFGKPQQPATGGGLFGKGPQNVTQPQSGSVFGTNQPQQTGSVFGGGGQTQQPGFGSNLTQPQSSVFGQSAPAQPPQTLFGKPVNQPQNLSSDPHANLFKPASMQNTVTQPQTAVVKPQNTQQAVSSVNVIVSSLYTPLDKLSKEDKEQFEAAKFTLGKIPMCPPPIELI